MNSVIIVCLSLSRDGVSQSTSLMNLMKTLKNVFESYFNLKARERHKDYLCTKRK